MIRPGFQSVESKRRNINHHRKKQFAQSQYEEQRYPHRLNFYEIPPTAEIELEKFEQWAIDRLRSIQPTDFWFDVFVDCVA